MTLDSLLDDLDRRGITMSLDGGNLRLRAETGQLTDEIRDILRARKTEIIAYLTAVEAPFEPAPPGPQSLSAGQRALWVIERLGHADGCYNMPVALELSGPLDHAALDRAFQHVVSRHGALRTVFHAAENAEGIEEISAQVTDAMPRLGHLDMQDADPDAFDTLMREEARRSFEIESGMLVRALLVRRAAATNVLILTVHHLICDAWSLGILVRELAAAYRAVLSGTGPVDAAMPFQFADFTAWHEKRLASPKAERDLAWWREHLADVPPLLELPTDRPRQKQQSQKGADIRFDILDAILADLNSVASEEGATAFMTLLAGFFVTLARFAGTEDDIAVGTPVATRPIPETEGIVGYLLTTLPIVARVQADSGIRTVLQEVKQATLDAFAHGETVFEQIVEAVNPARSAGHSPIFQTMFVYLPADPLDGLDMGPVQACTRPLHNGTSKFDMIFTIERSREGQRGHIEYNTDLFDAATIERFAEAFCAVLAEAGQAPDKPAGALEICSAHDHALAERTNTTAAPWTGPGNPIALIENRAAQQPLSIAMRFGDTSVSYAWMMRRANAIAAQVAGALDATGKTRKGAFVALHLTRSFDLVAAIIGVLKAGAAFLPLDPRAPANRLAGELKDAAVTIGLTHDPLLSETEALGGVAWINLDTIDEQAPIADLPEPAEDAPAYVIYTSGSTGTPKGILMPRRALRNVIHWSLPRLELSPDARVLQFAPVCFDICFQEILATFAAGGELVLISEQDRTDPLSLAKVLEDMRVTHFLAPFVALKQLAEVLEATGTAPPPTLRRVACGGEQVLVTPAVRAFFRAIQGSELYNHYGPSEGHVVCEHRMRGDPDLWPSIAPIGTPVDNMKIDLRNSHGAATPVGVIGEVHLSGPQIALGYLRRPDQTAAAFAPDDNGKTVYRTGDLARRLADGSLMFIARADGQLKIRGFRVEPNEIEVVLNQHPDIAECVVTVWEPVPGDQRLAAYATSHGTWPGAVALRSFLRERLPDYMIPSAFTRLDALPKSLGGKLDYGALPKPTAETTGYVAPRTPTERRLAAIWAEALSIETVGIEDDFFELGGHSLLATQIGVRVRNDMQIQVPLQQIFETPTIAALAETIDNLRWAAAGLADEHSLELETGTL